MGKGKKRWWLLVIVGGAALTCILVFVTLAALFMGYMNSQERAAEPVAAQTQSDVEREFQKVSPLPNAIPSQGGSMHKTQQGVVSEAYKTEEDYEAIKAYYDSELARLGWKLIRENNVVYDGQDYGGRERLYCKGVYSAELQYAGRQEKEFDWTYSFALTWGLSQDCK